MSKLGEAIQVRGLTVYRLAKITGIPQNTIYAYVREERDIKKARYETIKALSAALRADVDEIM